MNEWVYFNKSTKQPKGWSGCKYNVNVKLTIIDQLHRKKYPKILYSCVPLERDNNTKIAKWLDDGRSTWAPFSESWSRNIKRLIRRKMTHWNRLSKTVNLVEIDWYFIEKSRPEHDPKRTRLGALLPNRGRRWRHFRSKCKDFRGLRCGKCWSC